MYKIDMKYIFKKQEKNFITIIFVQVEFIIYNLSTESILIRVPCGGGHRSWDCMILNETTSFIYIQNKQIYIFDYPLSSASFPILQVYNTKFFGKQLSLD